LKHTHELPTLDRKLFPNLVIVGGTASGKTTVAYQLAKLIGFGVLDLDEWIEKRNGRPISEIFLSEGEAAFRRMETDALQGIQSILNHIIIPGGGTLEREENWEMLKQLGPSIWLATPQSEIIHRLLLHPEEIARRPKLAATLDITDPAARRASLEQHLLDLDARRQEKFKEADYTMTIGFATAGTCAQFIKRLLLYGQTPETN
jgi:shikimate kinase